MKVGKVKNDFVDLMKKYHSVLRIGARNPIASCLR